MQTRKGILLTGGRGCRLYPATIGVNKHLLPVWDRPLVYYPLATLIQSGVREILVITTEHERRAFETLFGHGARWGLRFSYETQSEALGAAHALTLAEDWLDGAPCVLAMGDNIFLGERMQPLLQAAAKESSGATVFAARVDDPQQYGVVRLNQQGRPIALEEKPARATSPWAVTGLYFYDGRATQLARQLAPSVRGEIEITDLNQAYLQADELRVVPIGSGIAWWDCGTLPKLHDAAASIRNLEVETGRKCPSPEEAALRAGCLSAESWQAMLARLPDGPYRRYLELLPTTPTIANGAAA